MKANYYMLNLRIMIDFIKQFFCLAPVEKGRRLWEAMDARLLKATGVTEADCPRLRLFRSWVEKLDAKQRFYLQTWLTRQLHDLDIGPELCSASEEAWASKWRQVYQQHLEIVQGVSA